MKNTNKILNAIITIIKRLIPGPQLASFYIDGQFGQLAYDRQTGQFGASGK